MFNSHINADIASRLEACTDKYLSTYKNHILEGRLVTQADIYQLWLISLAIDMYDAKEQQEFFHVGSLILKGIKSVIENSKSLSLGFFGGLAEISFIVKLFCDKTGCYSRFQESIYNNFLMSVKEYIRLCLVEIDNVKFYHYDAISGLSGIGYFILTNGNGTDFENNLIMEIVDYFHLLTKKDAVGLPLWRIKKENQATMDDIISFPAGHLNFSIAHGITGILAFLVTVYEKGNLNSKVQESLSYYAQIIKEYSNVSKDLVYWPTKVTPSSFLAKECVYPENYSWCYGMPSILRIYERTCDALRWRDEAFMASQKFDVLVTKINGITFKENIVCHGYTGLLCTLFSHYIESKMIIDEQPIQMLYRKILYSEDFRYKQYSGNEFLEGTAGELISLLSVLNKSKAVLNHLMLN